MTKFQEDALRACFLKNIESEKNKNRQYQIDENNLFFIQGHYENQALVKDRLINGYRRYGYRELSGIQVGPVFEQGLRSETLNSTAAQLFTACVPKDKDLRTNWGKGPLEHIKNKLFSLDQPYIEGNRKFLGFIRIDTDRVWRSEGECRSFYRLLAKDGKIASEPHFLVGLKLPDGRFVRPHAIWMLPYGSSVWAESGKEGFRRAPLNLFNSVYFGLCNALLEAGADAGAPSCSQQVKNPLSPEWYTICPQDIDYPDLGVHAEYLELNHTREKLLRLASSYQSNLGLIASNEIFNALQKRAYSVISEWHFGSDAEFQKAYSKQKYGLIIDRLHSDLEHYYFSSEIKLNINQAKSVPIIIAKVAEYAVNSWSVDKLQKSKKNRGVLMHVVVGMESLKERQTASAHYASQMNSERVKDAILTAYKRLRLKEGKITKSLVAKESGVSRATVIKYWQIVVNSFQGNECQQRCNDKKNLAITSTNNNHKITDDNFIPAVLLNSVVTHQNDNHVSVSVNRERTIVSHCEKSSLFCHEIGGNVHQSNECVQRLKLTA